MANILIIDNQPQRSAFLFKELEKDGHEVSAVESREIGRIWLDSLTFDIAVINFFPDTGGTWELYREFRARLPNFPILVYLKNNMHAINSLRAAVREVLSQKRPRQAENSVIWSLNMADAFKNRISRDRNFVFSTP